MIRAVASLTILLLCLPVIRSPLAAQDPSDHRARTLLAEGDALSEVSVRKFDQALARYQEAAQLTAASADDKLHATALSKLARGLFNADRHADAVRVGREANEQARKAGAFDVAGNSLRMVGNSLISMARFEEAEIVLKDAAELSAQYGSANDTAGAWNNLAVNAIYQGRLGEAQAFAREALAVVDRELARGGTISARIQFAAPFNVGKSLADAGNYMDARPFLERAFAAAERNNDIGGQMHVLFDTGEWYEAQGDLDRAERYYRRSIEFNRTHPSDEGAGKGYHGLGRVLFATARIEEAVAAHSEALERFDAGSSRFQMAPTLVDRARARVAAGDFDGAAADLERAITISQEQNHLAAAVVALVERGRQRARAGLLDAARADFDAAVVRAERDRLIPLVPAAWAGRAAVAEARNELPEALLAYEGAARALDRIRGRIVSIDLRASFAAATHDTFAGMFRVLMALHAEYPSGGYAARAFMALEQQRSQAMDLDVLEARATTSDGGRPTTESRIAQIQNALFAPDLEVSRRGVLLASLDDAERDLELTATGTPAGGQSAAGSLAELQQKLGTNDVVLAYAPTAAFVITATSMHLVPLDLPADLAARVAFFAGALESNMRDAAIASGRMLAARLLDPVLGFVAPNARVMVVASGVLARIPFAALPVTDNRGQTVPLFTRHELTYLPSLSIFKQRREASSTLERRALAIADAANQGEESRRLAPLSASRAEVRFVSRLMPATQLLIANDATEHAVKQAAAGGYSVVHFATHALLDPSVPARSAVLLGQSAGEDGLLQSREIYQLPLNGSLVVLSGCRTADGRLSAAEGLHSLSRAFLQAGGRTVVGALWDLPDEAAAALMMRFYTSLDNGRDAGAALREAQLAQAGADPYAASRTWAAMVLTGDPAVTLAARTSQVTIVPLVVVLLMLAWIARAVTRASDRR